MSNISGINGNAAVNNNMTMNNLDLGFQLNNDDIVNHMNSGQTFRIVLSEALSTMPNDRQEWTDPHSYMTAGGHVSYHEGKDTLGGFIAGESYDIQCKRYSDGSIGWIASGNFERGGSTEGASNISYKSNVEYRYFADGTLVNTSYYKDECGNMNPTGGYSRAASAAHTGDARGKMEYAYISESNGNGGSIWRSYDSSGKVVKEMEPIYDVAIGSLIRNVGERPNGTSVKLSPENGKISMWGATWSFDSSGKVYYGGNKTAAGHLEGINISYHMDFSCSDDSAETIKDKSIRVDELLSQQKSLSAGRLEGSTEGLRKRDMFT